MERENAVKAGKRINLPLLWGFTGVHLCIECWRRIGVRGEGRTKRDCQAWLLDGPLFTQGTSPSITMSHPLGPKRWPHITLYLWILKGLHFKSSLSPSLCFHLLLLQYFSRYPCGIDPSPILSLEPREELPVPHLQPRNPQSRGSG